MPHPLVSSAALLAGFARGAIPRRFSPPVASRARWSLERARRWQQQSGWTLGCNFLPSTAGNQLEMWQAASWDPQTIERELGWAAQLGLNAARVFLHDLVWQVEGSDFLARIEAYLSIAARHDIRTLFVLFDGVWNPHPHAGPQPEPRPHVHNSTWVQGPGAEILADPARWPALRPYVDAVLRRFGGDERVLGWDLFNEPDNPNALSYARQEIAHKSRRATALLELVFDWAQASDPLQPLTAGVYLGVSGSVERASRINRTMLARSDVLSFHSYAPRRRLVASIEHLARYQRPLLCTEWLARGFGSEADLLDVLAERGVGAFHWGLVTGRSQTRYAWTSWLRRPSDTAPWFHDLLHADGRPYRDDEAARFRRVAAAMRSGAA